MAEPSSNMFGCFPAVIMAFLFGIFAFAGFQQSSAPSITTEPIQNVPMEVSDGVQSLTVVEQIETAVSSSIPASITMQVRGYQPDGCTFPVQVDQTRDGNQVTVKIYRMMPKDILCSMELNPYNETITLDGTFDSGDYTIDVNGTMVKVKI